MQEPEGWLTHLTSGVISQSGIPLANHLQYKRKVKAVKTLTYILRIWICGGDGFGEWVRKQQGFSRTYSWRGAGRIRFRFMIWERSKRKDTRLKTIDQRKIRLTPQASAGQLTPCTLPFTLPPHPVLKSCICRETPAVLSKSRKQRSAFSNAFLRGVWVAEVTSEQGLEKVKIRGYALSLAMGLSDRRELPIAKLCI